MMGSLFSSISGLKNHTTWMNVIGNNISNVNTVGYKQSRITFKEAISQSMGAASGANGNANLGGKNPTQMGLGSALGSIDTVMTQGAVQVTGNSADVAIDGRGFFIAKSGDNTLYTRAGNFSFDNEGNLVTSSGALVQGWSRQIDRTIGAPTTYALALTEALDTNGLVGNIQIPQNLVIGPKATGNSNIVPNQPTDKDVGIILKGNLDSNTPYNASLPPGAALPIAGYIPDAVTVATVYDSLGTQHEITVYWTQTGNPTALPAPAPAASRSNWSWTAYDTTGALVIDTTAPAANQAIVVGNGANVTFNSDGSLEFNGVSTVAAPLNPVITLTLTNGAGAAGVLTQIISLNFGTDNNMSTGGVGTRDGITGDYGNGQFDASGAYIPKQTIYTSFVDGYSEGTLTGISVDQTGGINAQFSNNQIVTMAKLGLANFSNAEGLTKVGGTMFAQSANSGLAQISTAGNAGLGVTNGGALEASNVDLSVELTNMIIAQRGFESNARIVSTSSTMLDTLVNLGRG